MRVMEACVQWLGGRLEIAKLKNKRPTEIYQITWGEIMVEVNKVIEDMARGQRRERLADAAAHLGIVRIAWRNTTMHPKRTYTHEEARAIWQSVDLFVRSLCESWDVLAVR